MKTSTKPRILAFEEFLETSRKKHPPKSKEEIIQELKETIAHYEQKYQMSTEEFLPRYEKGEFEMNDHYDDGDLFEWRACYRSLQRLNSRK